MTSEKWHATGGLSSALMLAICLLALALRLGPLYDNRFHPDEALFSTWSLQIARDGNLLLTGVPIDKPPLLIYLNALSFYVFGQSELAARVPNLVASVVSVALLYQLASGRLLQRESQRLAMPQLLLPPLLLALSPFAISFAPTAFLDPMMIVFGLAALVAASRRHLGWAGILLGLSFSTKVQGLLFTPLVLVFASPDHPFTRSPRLSVFPSLRQFARFAFGFVIVASLVLIWDRARGGLPFWQQQTINYGAIRLIRADELGPRLIRWLAFLPHFFGPIAGMIVVLSLIVLIGRSSIAGSFRVAKRRRVFSLDDQLADMFWLAWLLGFFALHWLFNFPIWDRYFLLLVPIAAILIGRTFGHGLSVSRRPAASLSVILLVALLVLPFSAAAAESQYPIGGDHGANDGIDQVAVFLKTLPSGTVVYDHWLAWELGYYVGEGFVYVSYFDTPAALQDDLRVFGGTNRYVIFPEQESPNRVADAIGEVGYTLMPVFSTQNRFGQTSFTVFKIEPR